MRLLKLLLIVFVCAASGPAVAGPFEDAGAAHKKGDYASIQANGVETLAGIARTLQARGVKTSAGRVEWQPVQVSRLLAA